MKKSTFEIISPMESSSMIPEKDTYYIFHDAFFLPGVKPTPIEKKIAEKFLTLLNTSLDDQDEIVFVLQSVDLFNFLIHLQREMKATDKD